MAWSQSPGDESTGSAVTSSCTLNAGSTGVAMVLPDEALSENLLGLSFLSKLKRFEYANGKLVLEQ